MTTREDRIRAAAERLYDNTKLYFLHAEAQGLSTKRPELSEKAKHAKSMMGEFGCYKTKVATLVSLLLEEDITEQTERVKLPDWDNSIPFAILDPDENDICIITRAVRDEGGDWKHIYRDEEGESFGAGDLAVDSYDWLFEAPPVALIMVELESFWDRLEPFVNGLFGRE